MDVRNGHIRTIIALLSLGGTIIMAYLLYLHYASTPLGGTFCDLGEGFSCDLVNKSAYSEFLRIPMAGFGVLYFTLVCALAVLRYNERTLTFIASLLVILLGPSLYLTAVSGVILKSFCIFCELSKIFMALMAVLAVYAVGFRNFGMRKLLIAVSLALTLASLTYLVHAKTVVEPPSHLKATFRYKI